MFLRSFIAWGRNSKMRAAGFLILLLIASTGLHAQSAEPPALAADQIEVLAEAGAQEPQLLNAASPEAIEDEVAQALLPPDAYDPPVDAWTRLRAGFAMPDIDGPLVRRWEKWYASHPDYVARMLERSRRYLYHIIHEVERRGMPMEVAILPMIESAYNPMALSRARALGIWQFIPATGKKYGLEQNWWFDERRSVVDATAGALDYLETLHTMFGDWQLALAAYNCGEGGLSRSIARNKAKKKPASYSALTLPRETREYLPKLQAVKNILRQPEAFGLSLQHIPDTPYFKVVATPQAIDVKLAAELAEMPLEDFVSLNPGYNRPVIGGAEVHSLLLPVEKAESFSAKLALIETPLVSWRAYHLKPGERLEQVASRYGLDPEALRAANGIRGTRPLPSGVSLLVPASAQGDNGDTALHHAVFVPPPVEMGSGFHRVRRGETLATIAATYGATITELKHWNRLAANALKPGQRLRIGDYGAKPQPRATKGKVQKTVKVAPKGKAKPEAKGKKRV